MTSTVDTPAVAAGRTARAESILAAALHILETEGREGLTMRRLAEAVGIRAPSLYKHFPDKAAVELVLIEHGFTLAARAFEQALARDGATLETFMAAYRAVALAHPHLYRLMTAGPLPRYLLSAGVEERAAAPLLRVLPPARSGASGLCLRPRHDHAGAR